MFLAPRSGVLIKRTKTQHFLLILSLKLSLRKLKASSREAAAQLVAFYASIPANTSEGTGVILASHLVLFLQWS